MQDNKKRINAFIPMNLYSQITQSGESFTDCITKALELYFSENKENLEIVNTFKFQDSRIKDLQTQNESLLTELKNLNKTEPETILQLQLRIQDLQKQLSAKDESQRERISDLKEQIQALNEQINKKDKLLEELNQTLLAQASNIYNLTQNPKLLPEVKVKKWFEFWK
jgi:predicted RNase H-like nuclease (RuvC/YqgF family)